MGYDNFININYSVSNLDNYFIRTAILNALNEKMGTFEGSLLDIGCGMMPYKNYILQNSSVIKYVGLDIENSLGYDASIKPDFTWNGITMPFENAQFEITFATEVLEHCPRPNLILSEAYRVLKSGGIFFFTVPFIWPLHEVPHDEFRYTPFSLNRLLEIAGFVNIDIEATGGWHASLAQMLGLWVRRAPLSIGRKKILSIILKPFIKYLIKIDKYSKVSFRESQMITGLSGVAFKK